MPPHISSVPFASRHGGRIMKQPSPPSFVSGRSDTRAGGKENHAADRKKDGKLRVVKQELIAKGNGNRNSTSPRKAMPFLQSNKDGVLKERRMLPNQQTVKPATPPRVSGRGRGEQTPAKVANGAVPGTPRRSRQKKDAATPQTPSKPAKKWAGKGSISVDSPLKLMSVARKVKAISSDAKAAIKAHIAAVRAPVTTTAGPDKVVSTPAEDVFGILAVGVAEHQETTASHTVSALAAVDSFPEPKADVQAILSAHAELTVSRDVPEVQEPSLAVPAMQRARPNGQPTGNTSPLLGIPGAVQQSSPIRATSRGPVRRIAPPKVEPIIPFELRALEAEASRVATESLLGSPVRESGWSFSSLFASSPEKDEDEDGNDSILGTIGGIFGSTVYHRGEGQLLKTLRACREVVSTVVADAASAFAQEEVCEPQRAHGINIVEEKEPARLVSTIQSDSNVFVITSGSADDWDEHASFTETAVAVPAAEPAPTEIDVLAELAKDLKLVESPSRTTVDFPELDGRDQPPQVTAASAANLLPVKPVETIRRPVPKALPVLPFDLQVFEAEVARNPRTPKRRGTFGGYLEGLFSSDEADRVNVVQERGITHENKGNLSFSLWFTAPVQSAVDYDEVWTTGDEDLFAVGQLAQEIRSAADPLDALVKRAFERDGELPRSKTVSGYRQVEDATCAVPTEVITQTQAVEVSALEHEVHVDGQEESKRSEAGSGIIFNPFAVLNGIPLMGERDEATADETSYRLASEAFYNLEETVSVRAVAQVTESTAADEGMEETDITRQDIGADITSIHGQQSTQSTSREDGIYGISSESYFDTDVDEPQHRGSVSTPRTPSQERLLTSNQHDAHIPIPALSLSPSDSNSESAADPEGELLPRSLAAAPPAPSEERLPGVPAAENTSSRTSSSPGPQSHALEPRAYRDDEPPCSFVADVSHLRMGVSVPDVLRATSVLDRLPCSAPADADALRLPCSPVPPLCGLSSHDLRRTSVFLAPELVSHSPPPPSSGCDTLHEVLFDAEEPSFEEAPLGPRARGPPAWVLPPPLASSDSLSSHAHSTAVVPSPHAHRGSLTFSDDGTACFVVQFIGPHKLAHASRSADVSLVSDGLTSVSSHASSSSASSSSSSAGSSSSRSSSSSSRSSSSSWSGSDASLSRAASSPSSSLPETGSLGMMHRFLARLRQGCGLRPSASPVSSLAS